MRDVYIHIGEILARNARMYPDDIALVERTPTENKRTEMNYPTASHGMSKDHITTQNHLKASFGVCNRGAITWKQFDEQATKFANVLAAKGVQKGDKVVHFMMNSIDWLVAYFGIVRTGAWAVPLNFRFTAEDVKYCCDVAEPKVILFDEEFTGRINAVRNGLPNVTGYICVGARIPPYAESFKYLVAEAPVTPLNVEIALADPCGLYFTSGTTGQPKPILLTHKNMISACVTEHAHHRQTRDDIFILIPPLYHTGAKMHWFGSFIVGAKAIILKGISPEWTLDAVSEEGGTIVWLLVPWAQDILLRFDNKDLKPSDYKLNQWRLMHIGAQPVPPALINHWKRYFPTMDYDTNYGLSESAGPGCVHLGIGNEHKIGAIGIPGFNWETKIVDESGKIVLPGEAGELCVRGDGVMREYYKNQEATAKTLIDGWLLTGDMARQDKDGFIWLVDRKKDVIITGGENVFPVEVEDFLHTHPDVKDAAAIGLPDIRLGEIVAVIIETVPGKVLTEEDVLRHCEGLPKYKRPRKVFFDQVPRNPTGKIEKPKLRKQYSGMEEAFKI